MHFNPHVLFLSALSLMSGVLAQQSASATSGTPAVTFPSGDAFVFCSNPDCTGTCELVDGQYLGATENDGEAAPNGMGFQSFYWYNPYSTAPWYIYTCISYYNCGYVEIHTPNTCFNLLNNGVPTDFGYYWYEAVDQYRN